MSKYLVFAGDVYEPEGGMSDFVGIAQSIDEAKEIVEKKQGLDKYLAWWQIVDYQTLKIIEEQINS
jgi:hypothetical protein